MVDFKPASSDYQEHEVMLSDQLIAYLAEPDAQQAALIVLLKTRVPKIEWHRAARSAEQLKDFLTKTHLVVHEIAVGHFYKRIADTATTCRCA